MNEERRSGCSGENLRGLGLVLYLFTVTSAEDSEERGAREREKAKYSHKWLLWLYGHSILHVLLQTLPTNMFLLKYIKCRRNYNKGKQVLFYNTKNVCYRLKSQIYISNFIYFKNKTIYLGTTTRLIHLYHLLLGTNYIFGRTWPLGGTIIVKN